MRFEVRVIAAGQEVARLVVREQEVSNAVAQAAWNALSLHRDERGVLADADEITVTIGPHRPTRAPRPESALGVELPHDHATPVIP